MCQFQWYANGPWPYDALQPVVVETSPLLQNVALDAEDPPMLSTSHTIVAPVPVWHGRRPTV